MFLEINCCPISNDRFLLAITTFMSSWNFNRIMVCNRLLTLKATFYEFMSVD